MGEDFHFNSVRGVRGVHLNGRDAAGDGRGSRRGRRVYSARQRKAGSRPFAAGRVQCLIPAYIGLLGGDLTQLANLDGLSGLPAYLALLGGDPLTAAGGLAATDGIPAYVGALEAALGGDPSGALTALGGVDNFSALPQYASLLGGDLTALNNLASVSAIPPYIALAGGDIDATGGLDSVSAVRTFVPDPMACSALAELTRHSPMQSLANLATLR